MSKTLQNIPTTLISQQQLDTMPDAEREHVEEVQKEAHRDIKRALKTGDLRVYENADDEKLAHQKHILRDKIRDPKLDAEEWLTSVGGSGLTAFASTAAPAWLGAEQILKGNKGISDFLVKHNYLRDASQHSFPYISDAISFQQDVTKLVRRLGLNRDSNGLEAARECMEILGEKWNFLGGMEVCQQWIEDNQHRQPPPKISEFVADMHEMWMNPAFESFKEHSVFGRLISAVNDLHQSLNNRDLGKISTIDLQDIVQRAIKYDVNDIAERIMRTRVAPVALAAGALVGLGTAIVKHGNEVERKQLRQSTELNHIERIERERAEGREQPDGPAR